MSNSEPLKFPPRFLWGSATAAFQIEGGVAADGRGSSIWDTFSAQPGKIEDGSDARVAADHYHRWREDVGLMAEVGLQAYRFSISWPRILPHGEGAINQQGLYFYHRLIDALLENGIEPCPTLFHWDLPQALQDQGGWGDEKIVAAYAEYADVVSRAYGDRVKTWFTHNEPNIFAFMGHLLGVHAPGCSDLGLYFRVAHHLNRAHGRAVSTIRDNVADARVGMVTHQALFEPISEEDSAAANQADLSFNRLFLDPVLLGEYPEALLPHMDAAGVLPSDAELREIAVPNDFLGVNHYTRYWTRADAQSPSGGSTDASYRVAGASYTDMDWEIYPEGMYRILTRLNKEYSLPLLITENGGAFKDEANPRNGQASMADSERIALLDAYLRQVHRAIEDGCDVRGYFVWSLLDNFEWAEGLQKRFGLIHVDYPTGARTPRDSARWYGDVIAGNGL